MCEKIVWHLARFPWFNVTVRIGGKKDATQEVFMIPTLIQLKKILTQESDLFRIESIEYVTPGYMNGSGHWKMERLLKISELFNAFGWSIPRCEVKGHRVYRGLSLEITDEWPIERPVYSCI
jgi:hypothetical protein